MDQHMLRSPAPTAAADQQGSDGLIEPEVNLFLVWGIQLAKQNSYLGKFYVAVSLVSQLWLITAGQRQASEFRAQA